MRRVWLMVAAAGSIAAVNDPAPASAHAHVFVLHTVEVVFAGKGVAALRLRWAFDEIFSDGMFKDFDTDGNRSFDAEEVNAIREVSLPSMKEFGYFTHVWVNGDRKETFADVSLDVTSAGDTVIYEWSLKLAEPADPSREKVEISIFDDSYYVDVALRMPDAVKLLDAPAGCGYEIVEDEAKAFYFESIFPQVIDLSC